jgi:hypothetical protein
VFIELAADYVSFGAIIYNSARCEVAGGGSLSPRKRPTGSSRPRLPRPIGFPDNGSEVVALPSGEDACGGGVNRRQE